MWQWFMAGTETSPRFPFEVYSITPAKMVVLLPRHSGSDNQGDDCSPGVRERNSGSPRSPKSHAAKVALPPSVNGNGDCQDDGTRQKAVLR
jgi:hypothetical protein